MLCSRLEHEKGPGRERPRASPPCSLKPTNPVRPARPEAPRLTPPQKPTTLPKLEILQDSSFRKVQRLCRALSIIRSLRPLAGRGPRTGRGSTQHSPAVLRRTTQRVESETTRHWSRRPAHSLACACANPQSTFTRATAPQPQPAAHRPTGGVAGKSAPKEGRGTAVGGGQRRPTRLYLRRGQCLVPFHQYLPDDIRLLRTFHGKTLDPARWEVRWQSGRISGRAAFHMPTRPRQRRWRPSEDMIRKDRVTSWCLNCVTATEKCACHNSCSFRRLTWQR